jgi:DNA invertase Pin-like site-specific DNA recombinase
MSAPDRLSRKYAYQILLIEELARHGVETLFVKAPQGDSAEDQLLVQFQGMIAEYERAQFLVRSSRGKRHRAHSGEISVMSGAPYGYCYIRKTDEAPAAYTVYEAEARVVQRIYEMYTVQGVSIGEITRGSTRKVSRLAKRVLAGSARLSGQYCATPLIAASPASARRASLRGPVLCDHSVGGV